MVSGTKAVSPFAWLPDEVIVKGIFPNLSPSNLIRLTMVDQRFYRLANDSSLWKDAATSPRLFKNRFIKLSKHFKDTWLDSFHENVSAMTWYGELLVTTSKRTILVWDTHKHKIVHKFEEHKDDVFCVDVHGDYIISGSKDNTVGIWNPNEKEKRKKVHRLKLGKKFSLTSLRVKDEKAYIAVQGKAVQNEIQGWDLELCKQVTSFSSGLEPISQLEIKRSYLAQLSRKTVLIWDARIPQKPQFEYCDDTSYAPNNAKSIQLVGERLFCGLQCGNLGILDLRNAKELIIKNPLPRKNDPAGPTGSLMAIKVSDCFIYAMESRNRRISLWDNQTGDPVAYLAPWAPWGVEEPKERKNEQNPSYCFEIDEKGDGRILGAANGVMIRDFNNQSQEKNRA